MEKFVITRTEYSQLLYWTGMGWSAGLQDAKQFESHQSAKDEMENWEIVYTYRITPA